MQPDGYRIICANGNDFSADRVIIATGGGTDLLASLGHTIEPFSPVLCPLRTDTRPLKGLTGVRARARVSAFVDEDATEPRAVRYGEVLFRDYGLSGIVIFDMSREVGDGAVLSLDHLVAAAPQVDDHEFSYRRFILGYQNSLHTHPPFC